MRNEDSPFWVNVTLEDEEAEEKVRTAIECCRAVHEWAMVEMRSLWTSSEDRRVGYNELVVRMTKNLWKLRVKNQTQRFSLVTALSRAVGRFNQEMQVVMVGSSQAQVTFPPPKMPDEYRLLDIQSRSVWKDYMNFYNRFSTHYGGIYLDEERRWRKTLIDQAQSEDIKEELIHYLIYSATLREREEGWQAHFNFHKPQSMRGKKRLERT